jgi:UDP-N-acetylmuramoylalanine--D-glutamate ligase
MDRQLVRQQTVLVAGLGSSGAAAAQALRMGGANVITVDAHQEADLPDDLDWASYDFSPYQLLVVSPGWSPRHHLLTAAAAAGVEVISEVELAWRMRVPSATTGKPAPWLAVTGTNGKTTTLGMLEAILAAAGRNVAAVGNVGRPISAAISDPSIEVFAVELSSFQLHYSKSLEPLAAVCLNVADDHLDWHESPAAYRAAKARVYDRTSGACLYPAGDVVVENMIRQADLPATVRTVGFTANAPALDQLGLVGNLVVDRAFTDTGSPLALSPGQTSSSGQTSSPGQTLADVSVLAHLSPPGQKLLAHTVSNALAAIGLARVVGTSADAVATGLANYTPDEHRFSLIATLDEVRYINDSKATNAHAAAAALSAFGPGEVVWLAGGLAKGTHFDDLIRDHRSRLAAVVVLGVDQAEIIGALTRHAPEVPVVSVSPGETEVMTTAVTAARALARPGQVVLLAPACASMDQFSSYRNRGDAFVAAVRGL